MYVNHPSHYNLEQNGHSTTEEPSAEKKHYAILLKNCSFARNPKIPVNLTSTRNVSLTDISLSVKRGELVGIVGGMASGKSTLMSALCGEIKRTKGAFNMFDKTVYVPNSPWLKSGTIRDNILFGCSGSQHGITHRSKLYEKVHTVITARHEWK